LSGLALKAERIATGKISHLKISLCKTDKQVFDALEVPMGFELVEFSVLKVYRATILGLANHYYLAENGDFNHSLGWGAKVTAGSQCGQKL
jgi:hypothetical protein